MGDYITQESEKREIFSAVMNQARAPIRNSSKILPSCKHCILEVVSSEFYCMLVPQKGSYEVLTQYGKVIADIKQNTQIIHEYGFIGIHLRFSKMPMIGYTPLTKSSLYIRNETGTTLISFQLENVLVHFDNKSSERFVLKEKPACSFTYRSIVSGISVYMTCKKFREADQSRRLCKYFGIDDSILRGRSRNYHGVRRGDIKLSPQTLKMFSSIKKRGVSLGDQSECEFGIEKSPKAPFQLDDIKRRKSPFGVFEIKTSRPTTKKNKTSRFLFTTGTPHTGVCKPFVCPISGHTSFTMRIGNSSRIFTSFSKFVKTLAKWTHPCHATAKFKMFHYKDSPKISLWFNYDPRVSGHGEVRIQFWDSHHVLMNTYVCEIEHLCGVFAKKARTSLDSNVNNQREWEERNHCPHEDACPRNCAHYIPEAFLSEKKVPGGDGDNSDRKALCRTPIPRAIPCKCIGGKNRNPPIVSYYHYQIELGREVSIRMGGFFTEMLHDYRDVPEMYQNSPMKVLLDSHHDLLYHIEIFLYSFKA